MVLAVLAAVLTLASLAWACTPSGFGVPIAVAPDRGPAGTPVRLVASGYEPASSVPIDIASSAEIAEVTRLATVTTDESGRLDATVTIPDVAPGLYTLVAARGQAAFEVTPSPTPPATPVAPVVEPAAPWPQPLPGFDAGAALDSSVTGAVVSGDTTSPRVTVNAMVNRRLAVVLRRGIAFTVGCSERCRVQARAVLDAKTARRLRLTGVVARGSPARVRSRRVLVTMRLSHAARSRLRSSHGVKFKVTIIAADAAGNRTVVTRSFTATR